MIAAVLGATGFVGRAVMEELTRQGVTARAVTAPRLVSTASDVEGLLAQVSTMDVEVHALAQSLSGAGIVINAAGLATPGDQASGELTGANALLPVLLAQAAALASVPRFIHLSSAAVQGHCPVLDESTKTVPFSPYSRSKALGERGLLATEHKAVILRATSVQGAGRPTTASLVRVAASPLASVAAPGTAPTPVSSIDGLAAFVVHAATTATEPPAVVLQPWEAVTVSTVLEAAGGRPPRQLPAGFCRLVLRLGFAVSTVLGERFHGPIRRMELMWFGQRQDAAWARRSGFIVHPQILATLERARAIR